MPCTAPAGAGIDTSQARTLHGLVLEDHPHPAGSGPLRRGLFVDCETTGFSSEHDALIELAMLPFDYTLDGHITHVHRDPARTWRQDPGWPVPPEITRITGLTDEDLAGQAIDTAAASELLARSHLVVAHNASFDRSFVEAVVPAARAVAWACSRHEVAWAGRVPLEVPRVPPVRVRGIRAEPPPRARRLRGRRVAPHPNPARHRAHRLRRAPRDRGEAGSSDLGHRGPLRHEGPAPRARVPLDADGALRDLALVVDGRRPT